ncbi:MAG: hypothetical protein KME32_02925 [Mojavia pulchra JT2-VF2]|uniref:Uncharacterized protein n=1 Tax=Mojavia pulchra JT2-VF2 TaxID=287848 RepID=A0A951UFR9_9NOST|nr:hypothetical protein [Mojavia pulchra JT2-VF2]
MCLGICRVIDFWVDIKAYQCQNSDPNLVVFPKSVDNLQKHTAITSYQGDRTSS